MLKKPSEKFSGMCSHYISGFPKINFLWKQLSEIPHKDTKLLLYYEDSIFQENIGSICEVLRVLLKKSSFVIRLLSKSILLYDIAEFLKDKSRIIYSSPIASPISEANLVMKELQTRGYKTFLYCKTWDFQIMSNIGFLAESIWIEEENFETLLDILTKNMLNGFQRKTKFLLKKKDFSQEQDQILKLNYQNIHLYNEG